MSSCPHHRKPQSQCELCSAKKGAPKKATGGRAELDALLARASALAARNPAKAAIILTSWLNGSSKPARKKAA